MPFTYEAVDSSGKEVRDVVDVASADEAIDFLHARGLFVTRIADAGAEGSAGGRHSRGRGLLERRPGNTRDRMMLTQQMSMMLRAGSQVVPALGAIETQIEKPSWRQVVGEVRRKVEDGSSLSAALGEFPEIFAPTFLAIVSAGEGTGQTAEAFDRLSLMTKKQQEISVRVIGALVYPAVLLLMAAGVVCVLMFYVLPKFDDLYSMLGTPLPLITTVMISVSRWISGNKLVVALGICLAMVLPPIAWRTPAFRALVDGVVIRMPFVSRIIRMIVLAKIFRVWGTLVRSSVPLLESLQLARASTTNTAFVAMMDDVIRSVQNGDAVGDSLAGHDLVPKTMSSAISTGEQSGQLASSVLFLADYLDEENTQTLTTITRLIEPIILVIMGVVVGAIAIALFLPLFDLTAAVSAH